MLDVVDELFDAKYCVPPAKRAFVFTSIGLSFATSLAAGYADANVSPEAEHALFNQLREHVFLALGKLFEADLCCNSGSHNLIVVVLMVVLVLREFILDMVKRVPSERNLYVIAVRALRILA